MGCTRGKGYQRTGANDEMRMANLLETMKVSLTAIVNRRALTRSDDMFSGIVAITIGELSLAMPTPLPKINK